MNSSPGEQLQRVKLKALIADAGAQVAKVTDVGLCAALDATGCAWVLIDGAAGLGAAIAWTARHDAVRLHVIAESDAPSVARQAGYFAVPIEVSTLDGRALVPVHPAPLAVPRPAPNDHLAMIDTIAAAGATPIVEHGVVAGEVCGLEVCRVIDDPETGEPRLDVGVGAHDREMYHMLHGDVPAQQALADVVNTVAALRAGDAGPHPLNALARERLLRARAVEHPELIGATSVAAAQPPVPRQSLKDAVPCVALATIDGHQQAAVFSAGVDLELIVVAAEARAALDVDDAVVVVPARDALAIQQLISDQLRRPIRIMSMSDVAVGRVVAAQDGD